MTDGPANGSLSTSTGRGAAAIACPGDDVLRDFLNGQRPELADHIDHCEHCQARLDTLFAASLEDDSTRRQESPITQGPETSDQSALPTLVVDDAYLQPLLRSLHSNVQQLIAEWNDNREALLPFPGEATTEAPLGRLAGYDIVEQIGSGGTGHLYRGWDPQLSRFVAIKVLRSEFATFDSARDRFFREAHAAAQLQHPGVAAVYEVHCPDDFPPWIAQEFIEGESLQARLRREGTLAPVTAAEVVSRILAALTAAHEQQIVHRDVKPSNVLVSTGGDIKLVDFGLARLTTFESDLTADGVIAGTPAYMSPEQALSPGDVDHRGDIYSAGVVLYELLTGDRPFRGSVRRVLHDVVHSEPIPPRRLDDRIPRDLETICLKALAKDPAQRYVSAAAFAEDLQRFVRRQPVLARPVSRVERFLRWTQRNPVVAALSTTLTLGVLAGLVIWMSYVLKVTATNSRLAATVHSLEVVNRRLQTTQQQAERHAEIAQQQTNVAFDMASTLIFEVQQELASQPGTEELRRRLLTSALDGLQRVHGTATAPAAIIGEIMAANRMGDALRDLPGASEADDNQQEAVVTPAEVSARDHFATDQSDAGPPATNLSANALSWYQHAYQLARQLPPSTSLDEALRCEAVVVSAWNLGDAWQRRGETERAVEVYGAGLDAAQQWREVAPDALEARYNAAVGLQRMAAVHGRRGQQDLQRARLTDSATVLTEISQRSDSREIRQALAVVRYELWGSQPEKQTSAEIRAIHELLSAASNDADASVPQISTGIGDTTGEWRLLHASICVDAARHEEDPQTAEKLAREAIAILEGGSKTFPSRQAVARSVLARALLQQQRHAAARRLFDLWGPPAADWQPAAQAGYLLTRMLAEMTAGELDVAAHTSEEVESVLAAVPPSPDTVLDDQRHQWMTLREKLTTASGDQQ